VRAVVAPAWTAPVYEPRALCGRIHRAEHDLAAGLGPRTAGAPCPAGRQRAARARAKAAGLAGGSRVHLPEPSRTHSGAHWQSGPGTAHGACAASSPAAHTPAARVVGAAGTG